MSPMRGQYPNTPVDPEKVGLPLRPFLYSLDQLSVLLDVDENALKSTYIHYEGRSIGAATRHRMIARNIAPPESKPDWRVAERELVRWLKFKGFKHYERSSVLY
jgi:hypothetical protein